MKSLFSEADEVNFPAIVGLRYYPDYITAQVERDLVAAIDTEPWNTAWQRRRQLYGESYGKSAGTPRPIPAWGHELAERMLAEQITTRPLDQMLVNEYLPGQGISMHRDYETFDDIVVSLSLLARCVMDFVHIGTAERQSLLLEPRSLLVLSGPARYEWQHGIAGRKNDAWRGERISRKRRISMTYRSVKKTQSG